MKRQQKKLKRLQKRLQQTNKKELNDPNISWEGVRVKVFAVINEWSNKYYENCHENVVSNSAFNYSRKKCVVFECENDTYQMILEAIFDGQNVIRLSDYEIDYKGVKVNGLSNFKEMCLKESNSTNKLTATAVQEYPTDWYVPVTQDAVRHLKRRCQKT